MEVIPWRLSNPLSGSTARGLKSRGDFKARMIFLDAAKRGEDSVRTAQADQLLRQHRFHAIWSEPCLEALLLRHFQGRQHLGPATSALALSKLHACWPEYKKGMTAQEHCTQLDGAAVARAAGVVPALQTFLNTIGLEL